MNKKKLFKSLLVVGMAALTVVGSTLLLNSKKVSASTLTNIDVVSKRWSQEGGEWYWIESDGSKATGWRSIGGKWYYFLNGEDYSSGEVHHGEMAHGTIYTFDYRSTFYAFADDGTLYTSGWHSLKGYWFYSNTDGSLKTGWQKLNNKWYYFDKWNFGVMQTGRQYIDGSWYVFDASGAMKTGWASYNGYWYYCDASGKCVTGWKSIGGKWYHFGTTGMMDTGRETINGVNYYFDNSGAMCTGWINRGNNLWYYANPDGSLIKDGWKKIGSSWYYFSYFYMETSWATIDGERYYFGDDGVMRTGWVTIGTLRYYFYSNGKMAKNTTIDGVTLTASGYAR